MITAVDALGVPVVGLAAVALAGQPVAATEVEPRTQQQRVFYDYLDEGVLRGGSVLLPAPADLDLPEADWDWETIYEAGPSANRIDYVFVGDGYTAGQLDVYSGHVLAALGSFFGEEPFLRYESYFNVHRVDVISNESGVDNDPTYGVERDTALDMGFWCSGIERLLCVSVSKARNAAACAPDDDIVLAVANSTKYGGAGYISADLATFSGGNGAAPEVALHELGHSLGNLADEYDYNDGSSYNGGEPGYPNVSTLTAAEMASSGAKWADWLGENEPLYDGLVDTFEGALYCDYGIYRPTFASKMRTLNRPFNLPSVEALILEFYRIVDPIDDATPNDMPLSGIEVVFVTVLQPAGEPLQVQWRLDGVDLDGATGASLDLSLLDLPPSTYELSVVVLDNTPLVRDEDARQMLMREERFWTIQITDLPADLNGDGCVDQQDLGLLLAAYELDVGGDVDDDGDTDQSDLGLLLAALGQGCP